MTPVIRIPDSLFARLQKHAKPLVDTPVTVIERAVDALDELERRPRTRAAGRRERDNDELPAAKSYNPNRPPDLTHAKLLNAEFNGKPATNWNDLVEVAHRHASGRFKTYDALRAATKSNIVRGERTDSGFRFVPDLDVSIQGIDADIAWRNALHLAQQLNVSIRVEFEWRNKPGAAKPGKRGLLDWSPAA